MANLKISELNPEGSELFSDSESYMKELSEVDLNIFNINGGGDEDIILPSIPIVLSNDTSLSGSIFSGVTMAGSAPTIVTI